MAFLYGRIDYERALAVPYEARRFKLERMRELLDRLGRPDAALPVVHVAGTKGKGSTAALIAGALSEAGYRTGVFSSPHLDRVEERMAVDGHACHESRLVELVARVRKVVERMDRRAQAAGGPTYFEITTAMAFCHFASCHVDVAVLEVGLGGRLDSTNVCHPEVSIITSISYDHTQQLGDTLAKIAAEKAGIIKPGVPVVCGAVDDEARAVIEARSRACAAPLWLLGRDFHAVYRPPRGLEIGPCPATVDVRVERSSPSYDGLKLHLLGRHQATNAAVAVAALEVLRRRGWAIDPLFVGRGFAKVRCPARIEVACRQPTIVFDAAHNVASVEALLETLGESFSARQRTLVFAAGQDKDVATMLARLWPRFDRIVLTRYRTNPRGLPIDELKRLASRHGLSRCVFCPHPAEAWNVARETLRSEDLLCVTGSFFIAAELRRLFAATCRNLPPRAAMLSG